MFSEGESLDGPAEFPEHVDIEAVPVLGRGEAVVLRAGGALRELDRINHVALLLLVEPRDERDDRPRIDRRAHFVGDDGGRRRGALGRGLLPAASRGEALELWRVKAMQAGFARDGEGL